MPERIAGRSFYSAEETAARGLTVTPEQHARTQAVFDRFNSEIRERNTAPADALDPAGDPELQEQIAARYDDHTGTEFEGWTLDGGRWLDAAGNVVYTQGPGGWYDNTGTLVYDLLGNKPK